MLESECSDALAKLEQRLGAEWGHLREARELSRSTFESVMSRASEECLDSEDTSIVVMGSLARGEFTAGSDIDWYLLIDGSADPRHHDLFRRAGQVLDPIAAKMPGQEGTFGSMVFSHGLIHHIGGDDDTNLNTTRRLLLLLESRVAGRSEAWQRVIRSILVRYIGEDCGLWKGSGKRVPHFLLNDLTRFWRTMAVDFAYKLRNRGGKGWAIRNIKLRMSRKLIYVAGLLTCYSCHLEQAGIHGGETDPEALRERVLAHLEQRFSQTPLENIAGMLVRHPHLDGSARKIFDSYDEFVGMLANADKRNQLERLTIDGMEGDAVFERARELSHVFRDGLIELFFDSASGLESLTKGGIV